MTEKKKKARRSRLYPKRTLKDVLQLAQSIQDNNAGEPYNRIDLATSIDSTPSSRKYRELVTASSGAYILTEGGYQKNEIGLSELGKKIVAPLTEEERNNGLLEALENVPLFRDFIGKFDQKKLPKEELFKNNLVREFQIPERDKDDCYLILTENLEDWGLMHQVGDDYYLRRDKLGTVEETEIEIEGDLYVENHQDETEIEIPPLTKIIETDIIEPTVFISHSKNKAILEQIKQILEFGQYKSIIAVEQETTSIPIPEKIFGLMRRCNCAIINVSADEQLRNIDDGYNINPNVLIEIGAAFLGYNKKVILLWDKRVSVPSNLQGLYRVEYEGDELTWTAGMKLQEALTEFRKM